MKKVMIMLTVLLLLAPQVQADVQEVVNQVVQNDLFPAEYWISTDYNPDKNRDWTFHEISNGLKWKFKNKLFTWLPDEFWVVYDISPDKNRDWVGSEITGGIKWKFK